jgi:1-deoxy-D-xylulose-5-phosphate synthase
MFTGDQDGAGTFVIRYPRGKGELHDWQQPLEILPIGKGRKLKEGRDVAMLSIGAIGNIVKKAIEEAENKHFSVAHYDMIYLKPLDEEILHEVGRNFKRIITVENGVRTGGLGSAVAEFMADNGYTPEIRRIGVPDRFIEHGKISELYKICGIDAESIAEAIKK